jgi:hypothetical protein
VCSPQPISSCFARAHQPRKRHPGMAFRERGVTTVTRATVPNHRPCELSATSLASGGIHMRGIDGVFLAMLASMAVLFLITWIRIEWFEK